MATHDYVIDNGTGSAVRGDLNNVLQAILTNNSSSSAPSTTAAYMWWADTTNNVLKIRNSSNNGWVELLQLDGTITLEDGSASAPALALRDDLNTGLFSAEADSISITTAGSERFRFGSAGQIGIGGATYGSSGQVLTSQGASSAPTWATGSGTTINNNSNDRVITGSNTSNTLEAESSLLFDSSLKRLGINCAATTNLQIFGGTGKSEIRLQTNSGTEQNAYITCREDDGDLDIYSVNRHINFHPANTLRFELKTNGNAEITDGNFEIGTAGHGIDFSVNADNATGNLSELLDDYEEGQFLPTYSPASGSISTYTQRGEYCKIGRVVHCMFSISSNGSSSPSGQVKLLGIPFTGEIPSASGPRGGGGVIFGGYGAPTDLNSVSIYGNEIHILMQDGAYLQASDFTNTGGNAAQLSGFFSYLTAS